MADEVIDIERWFVARGVPHFIVDYDARTDIWTRAIPVLVVAYVLVGLNALDIYRWSLTRNLAAAAVVISALAAAWMLANALRRRPVLSRPTSVGPLELSLFVIAPALTSALFGQRGDALKSALEAGGLLLVIYLGTSYGVVPLVRWATQRVRRQLVLFFNVIVRVLPLLLLATTFLFINAEVWQMSASLTGPPYWIVVGVFVLLGVLFVLSRVPAVTNGLAHFDDWHDVHTLLVDTPAEGLDAPRHGRVEAPPLSKREKFNIGLVTIFSQSIQITLIAVVVFGFFVLFGFLAIDLATQQTWTQRTDIHVLAGMHADRRIVTEPLLRVAGFLAAFTGMYFTVVLATDSTYRDEFAEDVAPQVRQALAVRNAYRCIGNSAAPRSTRRQQ